MYIPKHFQIEDPQTLTAFIQRYSFATLISDDGQAPYASHVPVWFDAERGEKGTLFTHLARPNPQGKQLETGREVLVTFTGPHAYISPAWYATHPAVPTWNFTAVHVYGIPRVIADPKRLSELMFKLIEIYESPRGHDRWDGQMPEDFLAGMMRGIVGFEIEVTRIEGKFKLSQNRPQGDIDGVVNALLQSDHPDDRELATLMQAPRNP